MVFSLSWGDDMHSEPAQSQKVHISFISSTTTPGSARRHVLTAAVLNQFFQLPSSPNWNSRRLSQNHSHNANKPNGDVSCLM
jgi:hypothetical protein